MFVLIYVNLAFSNLSYLIIPNISTGIYNIIGNFYFSHLIFIINLTIIYLNNFNLCNISWGKCIQLLLLINMFIVFYVISINNIECAHVVSCIDNNNKDIHVPYRGYAPVDKETTRQIGHGISNVGANIGLAGTVGAVTAGMSGVISKSSVPSLQKVGAVAFGAVLGGGIHIPATHFKGLSEANNANNANNNLPNDSVSEFMSDIDLSPLEGVLWVLDILHQACIGLVYILMMQLVFKLNLKNGISLNLSKLLGDSMNNNIELFLNKIIYINKKINIF
jgi:hypothetical protein